MDSLELEFDKSILTLLELAEYAVSLKHSDSNQSKKDKSIETRNKRIGSLLGYAIGSINNLYLADIYKRLPVQKFNLFCEKFEGILLEYAHRHNINDQKGYIDELYNKWKSNIKVRIKKKQFSLPESFKKKKKETKSDAKKIARLAEVAVSTIDNLPAAFINRYWYCYELEEKDLSRKILHFTITPNNECEVILSTQEKDVDPWTGKAEFHSTDNLLTATLFKKTNKSYSEYTHLAIMATTGVNLSFCVGHKTYIHKHHKNIVTKTFLLEKISSTKIKAIPKKLSFSNVKQDIGAYFEDKNLNRISSPHDLSIINREKFTTWMKDNRYKSQVDSRIVGSYILSYDVCDDQQSKFRIQKAKISLKHSFKGHIIAEYYEMKRPSLIWSGIIHENFETRQLSVFLNGPKMEGKKTQPTEKPVFLMISIPVSEEKRVINTLTGVIAGHREGNRGAVARLAVLTKLTGGKYPKGYSYKVLKQFFIHYRQRSIVRPPYDDIVSTFSDLKKYL